MHFSKIINPTTGKENKVKVWEIVPTDIYAQLKSGAIKSAKDLSWQLLNERKSVKLMEAQLDGDAADNNFALSVFENALDWTLGMSVLNLLKTFAAQGKKPKPFQVAVNRKGDVFIVLASGRVIAS